MVIEVGKDYQLKSEKGTLKVFPLSIEDDKVYVKLYHVESEEHSHTVLSKTQLENHPLLTEV